MGELKIETKRKRFEIIRAQLENERSSFIPQWQDVADHVRPYRIRLNTSETNRGNRKNGKIIDSTAPFASRTLRSGMMSGVTSPARPWFRLGVSDPALGKLGPVKDWLHSVGEIMASVFSNSNIYNRLPVVYGDIGDFATSAIYIEEDFEKVINTYVFPIGSYMIACDHRGRVILFFREFQMTVRQIIDKFAVRDDRTGKLDFSNISDHVKNLWETGHREQWIDVRHIILPNDDFNPKRLESKHKRFLSCYYEAGTSKSNKSYLREHDSDRYLSEKGYDYFPVLCPRWEVTGEDSYGSDCPGMMVLGDIRALQLMQKRKAQAVEKMVNPPMVAPTSMQNQKASIIPGDVSYVDTREGQQGFRPAHEVNPRILELVNDIQDTRAQIKKGYFEDLFLMLANDTRSNITAREIQERHEEKLLALGPVLEQLNQDLLDPLIDIVFDIMERQKLIPEPPEELHNVKLKVEYISVMAQAQKLVAISAVEGFMQFFERLVALNPEAADKVDFDQIIDSYGEMRGVPPGIIRSDEKVQELRAARQQAMQAQAQAEMINQGAQTAKNLSQADMSGENALTALLNSANAEGVAG